jgi:hypothetical protein
MPLAGGPPAQLTGCKPDAAASIRYYAFPPDGSPLAVARLASAYEVVLIGNFK